MIVGFFGAVTVGSIVINDVVNNKLTTQGYLESQFLGISAYSYEYGLALTTILGCLFSLADYLWIPKIEIKT